MPLLSCTSLSSAPSSASFTTELVSHESFLLLLSGVLSVMSPSDESNGFCDEKRLLASACNSFSLSLTSCVFG